MSALPRTRSLQGKKIIVISRCAWTLYNFRLGLVRGIQGTGATAIALGAGGDGYDERLLAQGVDFRSIPVSMRGLDPLADLRLMLALIGLLRRERPDLVHCFTIKPVIYATLAAWLAGVPVRVVTITGLGYAFTSARGWLTRLVKGLYRVALRHAAIVYFQNVGDRQLFMQDALVDPGRTRLSAGSGVDTQRFAVAPMPTHPLGAPHFLMIARLIREKGVLEYLQAAAMVKARHPNVQFSLLGGVDPRNPTALNADEQAALRASQVVNWLPETDDVRPFIACADVVVLPSYREGLPRTLIEAGAVGRPVIATDVVGCRDVVLHGITGLLVPAMNAAALAEAMQFMVDHPEQRAAMGAAARARVVAHFDERSVVESTLDDYDYLLESR